MYNAYFGFKEAPFSIAPDPRYLYMTEQHREALAHLVYGLNSEGGCILLTGEVGTGKTTVCRCLLDQVPEQAHIALLLNPKVTATELLETICDELNIEYPASGNTVKTYTDLINRFLIEANARNEKTVLIIDEAQNLDSSVLEQLRLLTNLETNQRKLLQIIILGQPELLDILARKEMRQLAQRITARFHLNALSRNEVKAYVTHRLAVAGQNVQLFPEQTIRQLYRLSKGVPRLINILCDRALLGAYVQNKAAVDTQTLNTAASEVFGELKSVENKNRWKSWPRIAAVAASIGVIAVLLAVYYTQQTPPPEAQLATIENNASHSDVQSVENTVSAEATIPVETIPIVTQSDIPATDVVIAETQQTDASPVMATPVMTTTAQATTVQGTTDLVPLQLSDTLDDFFDRLQGDNKKRAYIALFKLWNRNYPSNTGINACTFAQSEGLSCLHDRGNLLSLRKLNRPAVLKLYRDNGAATYAIVTRLDQQHATLDSGTHSFDIELSALEKHWFGEFTLLWQKPPFYSEAIQPGSSGPVVQWLDQQLARLYGQESVPTIHDTYSEELISNVKKFQLSKGLIPDGVAGPLTFIHLNSEIGTQTPMLIQGDSQGA